MLRRPALFAIVLLTSALDLARAQQGVTHMSEPRVAAAAATWGARACIAGGVHLGTPTADIYDGEAGSWSTLVLTQNRLGLAAASARGKVLFAGGTVPLGESDLVELLDPGTGGLSFATLSVGRSLLAATTVGDEVLFAGGRDASLQAVAAVDVYDAATGLWHATSLSTPRFLLAGTTVGELALFAGGLGGSPSAVVDIYDGSSGTWSTASLSQARWSLAAASVGSKALFAGGLRSQGPTDRVDIFDATSGTWTTASLSQARYSLAAARVGSKVFFAGGATASGPASDRVDVYDDATGTWSTLLLAEGRFLMASTSVPGLALFAGGRSSTTSPRTDLVDLIPADELLIPFCFGDGSGSACPCGNLGAEGAGCANSTGAGATLGTTGWVDLDLDDLTLDAAGMPGAVPALAFAGEAAIAGGSGAVFGDGLRCAGTSVVRLGIETADPAGAASWGPGLAALGGWSAGDVRYLQVWYRDPLGGPCASTFNLTPGLEARFYP